MTLEMNIFSGDQVYEVFSPYSGLGREGIISAIEEMTELKTLIW